MHYGEYVFVEHRFYFYFLTFISKCSATVVEKISLRTSLWYSQYGPERGWEVWGSSDNVQLLRGKLTLYQQEPGQC